MLCLQKSRRELAGSQGSRPGGSAPTVARGAVASPVPLGAVWLHRSSPAPLDLLRVWACCSLASFELNFGEQIPHQLRRIRVWWDCAACRGSFLAMAVKVVGVGQLPLIPDGTSPLTIGNSCFSLALFYL